MARSPAKGRSGTILVSNYPPGADLRAICARLRSRFDDDDPVSFGPPTQSASFSGFAVDILNCSDPAISRRLNGTEFSQSTLWIIQDPRVQEYLKDPLTSLFRRFYSDGSLDLSLLDGKLPQFRIDLNDLSLAEFVLFVVGSIAKEISRPVRFLDLSNNYLRAHIFAKFESFLIFLPDVTEIDVSGNDFTEFHLFPTRPDVKISFRAAGDVGESDAKAEKEPEPPGWDEVRYTRETTGLEPAGWYVPIEVMPAVPEPQRDEEDDEGEESVPFGRIYEEVAFLPAPPGWFDRLKRSQKTKGGQ
jgi:hypothetical protein